MTNRWGEALLRMTNRWGEALLCLTNRWGESLLYMTNRWGEALLCMTNRWGEALLCMTKRREELQVKKPNAVKREGRCIAQPTDLSWGLALCNKRVEILLLHCSKTSPIPQFHSNDTALLFKDTKLAPYRVFRFLH